MVKLDCICMLYERYQLGKNTRRHIARNLIPDSSPQGHWDFFLCIEDRFLRDAAAPSADSALTNFRWVRRRMPCSTVGLQEGNTASKLRKLSNMALLECGRDLFMLWRSQVKAFTADQGVEKHIAAAPFGGEADVPRVLADLAAGAFNVHDSGA
eukprot:15474000-Alexandrium_andersonii.AAC.1